MTQLNKSSFHSIRVLREGTQIYLLRTKNFVRIKREHSLDSTTYPNYTTMEKA